MKVYVEDILAAPRASESVSSRKRTRKSVLNSKNLSTSRRLTQMTLMFSDIVALCTVINVLLICSMITGMSLPAINALVASFFLFPLAYTSFGLYRPVTMKPEGEILAFCKANLAVLAGLSVPIFFVPRFHLEMALWLALAVPLLILIVPFFRVLTRVMFSRADWWGEAAIVIGSGERGLKAGLSLQRSPELGIKPAALLQNEWEMEHDLTMPVVQGVKLYRALAKTHQISNVVVALDADTESEFLKHHALNPIFENIFLARINRLGQVNFLKLGGNQDEGASWLAQKAWVNFLQNKLKRFVDFTGAGLGMIFLAPFFFAITMLIKLTSKGPVFFKQERMGKGGSRFEVYKFRTMHLNAEEKLIEILETDPEARQEYEIFHKLRNDPRITSIGKVLRRYSLDEFPQLWNVVKGDMSLVGPRAYIPRELPKMRGMEDEVLACPPGLTGLWQVSGRNQLSFEERVTIDVNYKEMWSVSLDYYILLKTLPVVLTGNGAS